MTITVRALGGDRYSVNVEESDGSSVHEVTATPEAVERYAPGTAAETLVEASFRFLLEREPRTAILTRFDLPVIARYFPEFPARIADYLRG